MTQANLQNLSDQLGAIAAQLTELNGQVAYLAKKQQERDELFGEMSPILKEVMRFGESELQTLEERGYFTFARETLRALDQIVQGYDEKDMRALADNVVRIMDTVRAVTQPRMLSIAGEAVDAIDKAEDLEPVGVFGMVRASRDEDVQRGMAVLLAVLRALGTGVKALGDEEGLAPKRRALPATPAPAPQPRAAAPKKPAPAPAAAAPVAAPVMLDGVAFDAAGYLVDANQWTEDLGRAIAASQGITLTDRHWAAIQAARKEYLDKGASPNIRKLTSVSDITTKELYVLFPKAPAMTLARIAGIPKPVGCI
ncbi:MAG: TusE/DsrC/DsvC family sulfur relay protein [Polyangiaceae bacterium]